MVDHDDFVRTMRRAPADDLPRLAYADWLEERGDADWAEFIRVQCALAGVEYARAHESATCCVIRCEVCADWAEAERLEARERELWPRVWDRFPTPGGGPVYDVGVPEYSTRAGAFTVRRGFVDACRCDADDWFGYADALLAAQPVTRVALRTLPDGVEVGYDARERVFWFHLTYGTRRATHTLTQLAGYVAWPYARSVELCADAVVSLCGQLWPGVEFDVRRATAFLDPLAAGRAVGPPRYGYGQGAVFTVALFRHILAAGRTPPREEG